MVKKMFGVLVLALFILSAVPMALAEPGTGNGDGVMKNAKDKLGVAKERFDVAKGKYFAAKEKYKDAKEKYQEHKGNLLQIRENVKECKENEDCDEYKLGDILIN